MRKPRRLPAIHDASNAVLTCVLTGHAFDIESAPLIEIAHLWGGADVAELRLTCGCCSACERRDVIAGDGELLSRGYSYADDYLFEIAPTRAEARAELLRRKRAKAAGVTDVGSRRRAARAWKAAGTT
jgi:hypothetical protein